MILCATVRCETLESGVEEMIVDRGITDDDSSSSDSNGKQRKFAVSEKKSFPFPAAAIHLDWSNMFHQ